MAHPGGRPPAYETPEEMQKLIEEYIEKCNEKKEQLTITGLCYHLGFNSRQSFYDYEQKSQFAYTIKRARLLIENSYELSLRRYGRAGDIFALKNFGWHDKQEVEHSGEMTTKSINYNDLSEEEAKKLFHEILNKVDK